MHRHGYQGRKFGRERDQRNALLTGLSRNLFTYLSIETTLEKAKELRPIAEKLITFAKNNNLANRRLLISRIGDIQIAHKLVDEIAPVLNSISRDSGYLRIIRSDKSRVGDNAEIARIEFVDKDEIEKALDNNENGKSGENSRNSSVNNSRKPDDSAKSGEKSAPEKVAKPDSGEKSATKGDKK